MEIPVARKIKRLRVCMKQLFRFAVKTHPFIWLAFFAILAYWQIAFMKYGFKWENIDIILPLRAFVSNCLIQGEFPFWNPYQQGGYPIFADLKSVFSPEIWLIGSSIGYSVFTFHFLFIIYVFIAGVSSFRLLNAVLNNRRIAAIGSIIYMLSGFIVQHGHDLSKVIAAAWFPFAFHFFLRLFMVPSLKSSILASLFFYLLIASGYIPLSIILAYFVLLILFYFVVKYFMEGQKYKAIKIIFLTGVSAILISLLILPQILSYSLMSDWHSSFDTLTVEEGSQGAFPVKALLSLILPFAGVKEIHDLSSNIEMRNIYFGIVPFTFFLLAFIIKKPRRAKYAIFAGIFFLIVSFGSKGYLHTFLFTYIPFLNLFPNPGYYNIFTELLFILVAIWSFRHYFNTGQKNRKKLIYITIFLIAILSVFVIWAWNARNEGPFELLQFEKGSSWILQKGDFYEHVIIQGVIQIFFLVLLLLLLAKYRRSRFLKEMLFASIVFEMLFATQIQSYFTVVSNSSAKEMHREIARQSKSFLLPDINLPVSLNADGIGMKPPFNTNTNIFKKKVSFEGKNHFELNTYALLKNKYTNIAKATISNPVLYASNEVLNENSIDRFADDSIVSSTVFVPDSIISKAEFGGELHYSVKPIRFKPNEMTFDIIMDTTAVVVLQQSYFPGWKLYIDEQQVDIFNVNVQFIGALLKKGKFRLEYRYDNPSIYKAWVFSFSLFLILIALTLLIHYSGNKRTFSFLIYLGFLSLTAGIASSYQEVHQKTNVEIANTIKEITANKNYYSIINSDRSQRDLNNLHPFENAQFVRVDSEKHLHSFINNFRKPESDTLVLMNVNLCNPYSLVGFFEREYLLVDYKVKNHFQLYYFVKSDIREEAMYYDFDWMPMKWKQDSMLIMSKKDNKFLQIPRERNKMLETIFTYDDLTYKENFIFNFSARIKLIDSSNIYIIVQQEKDKKDLFWHSYNILNANIPINQWVTISHSIDMPQEISRKDSLSVFIWNPDSVEMYVDDVLYRITPFVFK